MQMSSATADHHREAAEYYEVSVRQKCKIFPRGHCPNVTIHRFLFFMWFHEESFWGLGEDESTLRCHLGLRDVVKSIYSNI